MGLGGVAVQLSGVSGATTTTDDNGQYAFTGLRMGNYSVEISGFDNDEIGFSNTAASVSVGVGESKIISFDGTYLRTAGIMGRVSVEGDGLEGVTVSLAGGPDNADMTTMTDAAGQYSFSKLRAGDYAVGISGYNTDDYEFEATSMNVTVALGETATVPFEGVLLRTSGISGRVSVEGMGLADIMVTLSMADADDMTAMTDAGGLYAFSGLAAGDYTVGIMVESDAYVFDTMSMDVTVAEDMTAIVNFEGTHATTASVSGTVFIDELMKNDMMDDGEAPAAHAGIPLVLVGPGVNDQMPGGTNEMGQFMFANLKAGNYQLVFAGAAVLPEDFAYGGSATGYAITVGVGEAATQNIPIDITHTTVVFAVTLKGGDARGMPVPGATVTLYSDAMGETKVGEGETAAMGDHTGATSIRFARAGTTGNTVYAGVETDYFEDPTAGMQAVMWNPQSPVHPMPGAMPPAVLNDADIVNLAVDVTFGGATVMTEYGGGEALAGWVVGVMTGNDPTDLMTVEGAPAMLDEDGMAHLMTAVTPDALPAAFHFGVAPDQDDKMDGGESYEGTTATHVHTGLSLASTMDAGMLEVAYTTQTLKVYVHHELDQVMGYTGNILGGDERVGGMVDLEVRYIDNAGRSRSFTNDEWNEGDNTSSSGGATTYSGLPADANVIVQASEAVDGIMLLEPDELATYTAMVENGVMGGAFGDMGGFSHTVSLCPLMATDPTAQDHGECGSFAFVSTHSVSGLVWKNQVLRSNLSANDDAFKMGPKDDNGPTFVAGVEVTLDPVEGKNLAGDQESYTSAEDDDDDTDLDETHQFAFNDIAAGVYDLSVSDGWRYKMGGKGSEAALGDALNPLDEDVSLDVTPTSTTVYGYVRDSEEFPVEDVTVNVNGVEAVTDVHGRYIAEYVGSQTRTISRVKHSNMVFAETAHEGNGATRDMEPFVANGRIKVDIDIEGVGKTASISGTVTASGSGAPVAGAEIMVDDVAPTNAVRGKLVTGADGTYTATIAAKDLGTTAKVTVSKAGMSFVPAELHAPAHGGSEVSGINFAGFLHATISGRVKGPDGNAMGGVEVTATNVVDSTATPATSTSNARGTFVLSVPFGTYDIEAAAADHTFSYPNNVRTVSTAPGQAIDFGDIQAMSPKARNVKASRTIVPNADTTATLYDGEVVVTWTADGMQVPAGYMDAVYSVQTNTGADGAFEEADQFTHAMGDTTGLGRFEAGAADDGELMVQVVATAESDNTISTITTELVLTSDPIMLAAVDPTASGVSAERVADSLKVSWNATTNDRSDHRVVIEVAAGALGGAAVWFVRDVDGGDRAWQLTVDTAYSQTWTSVDGAEITITDEDLDKALMIAVESIQGEESADNPWVRSAAVAVTAKPE